MRLLGAPRAIPVLARILYCSSSRLPQMRWRSKDEGTPSSTRHLQGRPPSPQHQHEIAPCAICQDSSRPISRPTITTACGHCFHAGCIGQWMHECENSGGRAFGCPVCRCLLTHNLTFAVEPATKSEVETMALPNVSNLDLYLRRANAEPEPPRAVRPRAHSFDVRSLAPNVLEWQGQARQGRPRARSLSDVSLPPRPLVPVRRFSNRPFDWRKEVQIPMADPLDWISRMLGRISSVSAPGGTWNRNEQPRRHPDDELFGHHRLAFLSTWFDVSDSDDQSNRSEWQSDWQSESSSARDGAKSQRQTHDDRKE